MSLFRKKSFYGLPSMLGTNIVPALCPGPGFRHDRRTERTLPYGPEPYTFNRHFGRHLVY